MAFYNKHLEFIRPLGEVARIIYIAIYSTTLQGWTHEIALHLKVRLI